MSESMKHERAIADGRTEDERRLDDLIAGLPPCPGLPGTAEEEAEADTRAREDIAEGRIYRHELIGEWVATVGRDDYRPFKEWLAARDG